MQQALKYNKSISNDNMHPWVIEVEKVFRQNSNPEYAKQMAAYMKYNFPYLGINTPLRKTLLTKIKSHTPEPELSQLKEVVLVLWAMNDREFQYVALYLLQQNLSKLTPSDIPFLLELIPQKSWWDSVDTIAGSIISGIVKKQPLALNTYLADCILNENFWINRTAIIAQLKLHQKTDVQFLTAAILPHMDNKEFFLRKAIGWSLRQYAKSNPQWVIDFVHTYQDQLSGLSKREALKHIKF